MPLSLSPIHLAVADFGQYGTYGDHIVLLAQGAQMHRQAAPLLAQAFHFVDMQAQIAYAVHGHGLFEFAHQCFGQGDVED